MTRPRHPCPGAITRRDCACALSPRRVRCPRLGSPLAKSRTASCCPQPAHQVAFLKDFLERPKEVGSIIPRRPFFRDSQRPQNWPRARAFLPIFYRSLFFSLVYAIGVIHMRLIVMGAVGVAAALLPLRRQRRMACLRLTCAAHNIIPKRSANTSSARFKSRLRSGA